MLSEDFSFQKSSCFASTNGANGLALQAAPFLLFELAAADPRSSRPYAF